MRRDEIVVNVATAQSLVAAIWRTKNQRARTGEWTGRTRRKVILQVFICLQSASSHDLGLLDFLPWCVCVLCCVLRSHTVLIRSIRSLSTSAK